MGSSAARLPKSSSSTEIHEPPPTEPLTAKPALPTTDSFDSMDTIVNHKTPARSTPTKQISTGPLPTSQYVVDLSTPSPVSSAGSKTPLKSPIPGDGAWSTAATPGLDSPNFGGSWGRAAMNSLSPATLAVLNSSSAKGDNPLSPGASPKPRSGLGTTVVSASDLSSAKTPHTTGGPDAEDGIDTDEEDGQWSTAGNDPFSRQNSMIPLPAGRSFSAARHAPGLMMTSSLGAVHEEGKSKYLTLYDGSEDISFLGSPSKKAATENAHNLTTPAVLAIPLPASASNSVPSSPGNRPSSVAFAASHPLPPLLPPPSKTPSSIKSESRVLPSGNSDEKVYKYTSNIVGDSTSDSEAGYNVRKRANTVVPSHPGKGDNEEKKSSYHVRSSSVTTAAVSQPVVTPTEPLEPPKSATSAATSVDDDWERHSLSRLARLPDSVTGSDMDSLSGRLRDLDTPNTSSSEATPIPPKETITPGDSEFKSRRNTIRANAPSDPGLSGSDFGFTLPGVPSAPPVGDWSRGSGKSDSDSGGEGDVMARLPSAPAVPPLVQDQLPHVIVFHKPASPREEIRVNPHFPSYPPPAVPTAPKDDSITPRSQSHARAPSSGGHVVPPTIPPLPPVVGYSHPPTLSTTSSSDAGSTIHLGYTPPNSVVTPHTHASFPGHSASAMSPPYPHYPHPPFPQHPYSAQLPGHYAPVIPANMQTGFYGGTGQVNELNGSQDEFGLGIPPRTPPTALDPETVAKAQKHAKFAQSALNFDDLETARQELKKALRLLS
jgi:hypothetical protein